MPSCVSAASRRVRIVPSYTDARREYQVSRTFCICKDYILRRRRNRLHRCKHQEAYFPFWCARCGQAPAAPRRLECWTCINRARDNVQASRLLAALADVEWPQ